jgi:hypothetical protein
MWLQNGKVGQSTFTRVPPASLPVKYLLAEEERRKRGEEEEDKRRGGEEREIRGGREKRKSRDGRGNRDRVRVPQHRGRTHHATHFYSY